jgi:16S rRNA (guanine966-N2)-methyltransferase
MRVIAGSAKGRRLAGAPAGVRPVADRVREGLFSSLGEGVTGARVLDLFAGTGALGIEALSRGASHALFVDQDARAVATIRENLGRTELERRASVVRADVRRAIGRIPADARYDLVFLDPPYDLQGGPLDGLLALLGGGSLLEEGARVALTRESRSSTVVIPLHWTVARRLAYGDSVVTLFRARTPP